MPDEHPITPQEQSALVRYSAITYLTECLEEGLTLADALRRASSKSWPNDHGRCYAVRTLEDWWYTYQKDGFTGLTPEARQDFGQRHTLTPQQQEWLTTQRETYPDIPIKVAYQRWRKQDQGHNLPSLTTIYRFLKKIGLTPPESTTHDSIGPKKAFEAPFPNDLWMADFSPGPKLIQPDGKHLTTHLAVIIDDHSRLLPYAAYYLRECTETFHHTLKEAVLRRGLPHKLYVDNGAPFISKHTHIVCANLGIRLLHHKPYRAWSKGKVERVIHTIQLGFETTLSLPEEQVHTLDALNAKLSHWIQTHYHTRPHSSTGTSPQARFQESSEHLRQLDLQPQALDKLFQTRVKRTVRKNGTIRLHNQLYEVSLTLRGRRIELRYNPFTPDIHPEVYYQGHHIGPAHPVDLHLNSQLRDHQNYERR
mgnify:CR=1 FL=1|tara:strand:+ start:664 stop:1929 length:1266 start_codon:yes stop_codon:yes gene_type:complete